MLLGSLAVPARRVFVAGALLWIAAYVSYFVAERMSADALHPGNDFYCYYVGSRVLWNGGIPYHIAPDSEATRAALHLRYTPGTGYSYPPLLGIAMFPFLLLPPVAAAKVWISLMLVLYLVFCHRVVSQGRGHPNDFWTLAFLFTFTPAAGSIINGQVNIVVLFLIGWYLYSPSPRRAGLSLAIASLVKVFPCMLAARDVLQRRTRVLLWFAISGSAIVAAIVLAGYGRQTMVYFLKVLPDIQSDFDPYYTNQSVNGFVSRLFVLLQLPQSSWPPVGNLVTAVCAGLVIAAGALTVLKKGEPEAVSLVWLGITEVIAGKNSFWNLTPCVFIGLYLLRNWDRLRGHRRALAIASMLGTNVLWVATDALRGAHLEPTPAGFAALVFRSIGFLSLAVQVGLLVDVVWRGSRPAAAPAGA